MGNKKTLKRLSKSRKSIGSGNHAVCYQHPTKKNKVILVTHCPVRASLARGEFSPSEYFPKNVKLIGELNGVPAYQMEKYREVEMGKLSAEDQHVHHEIRGLCTPTNSDLPQPLIGALNETFDMLKNNNGYVSWDVCSHNMMMDKNNRLVLNDILWVEGYDECTANQSEDHLSPSWYSHNSD